MAENCNDMILFFQTIHEVDGFQLVDCSECECRDSRMLTLSYNLKARLEPERCDEATERFGQLFLSMDVVLRVRSLGPAGTFIAYHTGNFDLISDSGVIAISGTLQGTDGVSTDSFVPDHPVLCERPERDEGTLVGQKFGGRLEGQPCEFVASYTSNVIEAGALNQAKCGDDELITNFFRSWRATFAGMLAVPCGLLG